MVEPPQAVNAADIPAVLALFDHKGVPAVAAVRAVMPKLEPT